MSLSCLRPIWLAPIDWTGAYPRRLASPSLGTPASQRSPFGCFQEQPREASSVRNRVAFNLTPTQICCGFERQLRSADLCESAVTLLVGDAAMRLAVLISSRLWASRDSRWPTSDSVKIDKSINAHVLQVEGRATYVRRTE